MELPLEDNFEDIISKAQKGLGLATEALAARADLDESRIRALRRGELDRAALVRLAPELGLRAEPLAAIAERTWRPKPFEPLSGFASFVTLFGEGSVNAYLVWDPATGEAAAIDTGMDALPLIAFARQRDLVVKAVLLTHAHRDHVAGLGDLEAAFGSPVYLGPGERVAGPSPRPIAEGWTLTLGGVGVRALSTPGHSPDAMSFVIDGLSRPLAAVGDALFAGSMGGPMIGHAEALRSLRRLLELAADTVLAPGHGPLTTVAEERLMNPFWPGPDA